MLRIKNILDKLKKQDQQDYGVAVFDIDLEVTKKGVFIFGEVLIENQKDKVLELLKKENIEIANEKIKVLSDVSKRYEIGWVVVKAKIADLKSRFVSEKNINENILKRIRCSQAFKGEILRVLYKNEDQLLVQQNDLTLGWINKNEVIVKKESFYKEWKKGNYAIKDKLIKSKVSIDVTIKEAEKYLGSKYLLGGKTKNGIDCSALIQIVYKNSLGIVLPKHSWDQKKIGKKVDLKDIETGDLIFLIKKNNKHKHVGIVEVLLEGIAKRNYSSKGTMELSDRSNINLIHASLDQKKVIRQDLKKVFEDYDFVEAKRVIL
ncbi:MAG: C40 family peptidase [Candidatus Pacebacteria bacterium]|nr:C40 family peptidase [Candidatus Paceibacterota bacterium]